MDGGFSFLDRMVQDSEESYVCTVKKITLLGLKLSKQTFNYIKIKIFFLFLQHSREYISK